MDNFKQKFLEEATDLINSLEDALLTLESSPEDKNTIEEIFRIMHSLKGSGAMFGFEKISSFTHYLESVYDQIRNNELTVTPDLLNITLSSVDYIKALLETNDGEGLDINKDEIINELLEITQKNDANKIKDINSEITFKDLSNEKTFLIKFTPFQGIFDNGTNPLYLLDELQSMGACIVFSRINKLPYLQEMNAITCYTNWEIIIATSLDLNTIQEVFIFVEDEADLKIIELAQSNLLAQPKFLDKIDELKEKESIDENELFLFVEKINTGKIEILSKEETKKEKKKPVYSKDKKDNLISSIRVSSDKLDYLMNLVSELVTTQARLNLYAEKNADPDLVNIAEEMQKLSRQLRDNAFDICLVPIANMLTRFKRLIRDLAGELKKEVEFITEGTDTELDKTIVENLSDPLMHIIRNCLDHGIENTEERIEAGKSPIGKIFFKAFYSGTNVHICISDDGRGINLEKIRQKAVEKEIINKDNILSDKELIELIFHAGFTTAKNVTDVSGRGVGMDIVRRRIDDVRGEIEVNTEEGKGTSFTFKLPLTLSIIDGLLVKISETFFVIPLSVVDKIYETEHEKVNESFNNLIVLEGTQLPFLYLRKEFNMKDTPPDREQVILIRYEDKQIGLTVDNVIGEYQAVLKPLGRHYKEQEIISGATILGDGTIALVMDTNKIIKIFAN